MRTDRPGRLSLRGAGSRLLGPVAVGLAAWLCAAGVAHSQPASPVVIAQGGEFEPRAVRARLGSTVAWLNEDSRSHTVTARSGQFDSGPIEAGARWSWTATATGEFPYFCSIHPEMTGVILVEPPGRSDGPPSAPAPAAPRAAPPPEAAPPPQRGPGQSPTGVAPRAGGMPRELVLPLLLGAGATVAGVLGMVCIEWRRAARRLRRPGTEDAPADS